MKSGKFGLNSIFRSLAHGTIYYVVGFQSGQMGERRLALFFRNYMVLWGFGYLRSKFQSGIFHGIAEHSL